MMQFFRRVVAPIVFTLVAVGLVFVVVSSLGGLPLWLRGGGVLNALPTGTPAPVPTLTARLEQLNPDILDAYQAGYGAAPLGAAVQPLGAYLPASGNRQMALVDPTPMPTAFPYPTTPPLIIPNAEQLTQAAPSPTPPPAGQPPPPATRPAVCAPSGRPVAGVLTQRYHRYHLGIDIGVPVGTPVLATHSGQVVYAGWNDIGYGYLVILQDGAFITYYAHNSSLNVVVGQLVGKGDVLALSGSTGNSTGPHVHYETRVNDVNVDPFTFENRGYATC